MNSRRRPRGYAQPISNNNTQSSHNHNCGELKNEDLAPVRSLKRKKSTSSANVPGTSRPKGRNSESQRAENRAPTATTSKTIRVVPSISRQSSTRVMAAMGQPPSSGSDFHARVSLKKDKGTTEETSKHPRDTRRHNNNIDETDRQHSNTVGRHFFTGPLAVAEHERMKKEIETLKETLHESGQVCRLQAKQLDETRAEANAAVVALKDREIELVGAKAKSRKNEELLSTIESSVQCQICMDLPERPFALNPCGHVLCLSCLQEWFRKAPPALDDMDADPDELTDPQYVLMRSKTCPSCRAVLKHRPVPIFMIKSVVAAIKKTKSPHTSSPGSRHNDDYLNDNPWKGIFTSSEEEADDDGGEDDDESQAESDSDDLGSGWYRQSHSARFDAAVEGNATSESEMENENEEEAEDNDDDEEEEEDDEDDEGDDDVLYTQQRWAPPTVSIPDYHIEGDDVPNWGKLIQRGCSWDMLHNFDVSYSHDSGIVVALRSLDHLYASDDDDDDAADDISMYRVFLGWNIALDPDDSDGENYIQDMLREIKDVPERWEITPTPGMPFAIDARRLVFADEAEEYDTTDTDAWIDNEEDL